MSVLYTNNATTTLSASITNSTTSLSVASGTGSLFPAITGSDFFFVTISNSAGTNEIVKVTARSVDTLTIVRAQDGTSAAAWSAGDKVELRITKAMLDQFKNDITANLSAHTGNTSNPHSVTATQVGLGNVENKSSATIRSEITSSNVTTALGYTPYNSTNPSGYITGITSGNVTTALGFTPLSTTGKAADSDLLDGQHGSYYQPASTAITTSNIGSQSVNYATSAGSASSCSGNAATATTATTATNQSGGTVNATSVISSAGVSDVYSGLRVVNPGGGALISGSGVTGAIKIKLPVASLNSSTMLRLTVKIYEYNTGYSRTFEIGGYNYGSGNWYNWFATQSSQSGGDMNVRFGQDATSDCIWIGETSSSWSYPQVFITDVQCGYSNTTQAMWSSGWAVSFVTAFDTVEQSTVAYRPLSSGNYNSYAPTLTGTGASGTWGISISGNAATATNSTNATNATYATYVNTDSYNAKFHWSGQSGQPTWLWGSNNGSDIYVWNPSNFSVAYASSAGNADTLDGYHASSFLTSVPAATSSTYGGVKVSLSGTTLTITV